MTNRKIKEAGVHPVLGYLLGLVGFALISIFLFHKTELAQYLIIFACFSFQLKLSENRRTEFLRSTFGDQLKNKIRLLENLIISIPFVTILAFNNLFIEIGVLLICSTLLAFISFKLNANFTIPTPFSKRPYEFPRGFRMTFFLFPIAYTLSIIAVKVGNLNLGIFSMLIIYITTLSYYSKPEEDYFVWVHTDTPKSFLTKKIITATVYSTILTIPIMVSLSVFFSNDFYFIFLFLLLGTLFLWTIILAKYAAFPNQMNVTEALLIALSLSLPPLLLLAIPFFYFRSINNLKLILHD